MKLKIGILMLFCIVSNNNLFSQDTSIYKQAKAAMFSNYYVFYKKDSSDNFGTFKQKCGTDDMGKFYGQGKFKENKRKIYLYFDTIKKDQFYMESNYSSNHKDTVYIYWSDVFWENKKSEFYIRYSDTTISLAKFHSNKLNKCIKLSVNEIKDIRFSLYSSDNSKFWDFKLNDSLNEINIYDTSFRGVFVKKKEVLKKNQKGFITIGLWTRNKKTQFVKSK